MDSNERVRGLKIVEIPKEIPHIIDCRSWLATSATRYRSTPEKEIRESLKKTIFKTMTLLEFIESFR